MWSMRCSNLVQANDKKSCEPNELAIYADKSPRCLCSQQASSVCLLFTNWLSLSECVIRD
jgi:transposase